MNERKLRFQDERLNDPAWIRDMYENHKLSPEKISEIIGCSADTVYQRLRRFGIKKRTREEWTALGNNYKHTVCIDYFDNWSPDMAYILGFTMADGNISKNGNYLRWTLNTQDRCVLEFIRDRICPTGNIKDMVLNYSDKPIPRSILYIWSQALCSSLNKYNIIPSKTGREVLPEIPEEFKPDYLRGLFDGDGSLIFKRLVYQGQQRGARKVFQIASGCPSFLEQVRDELMLGFGRIELGKDTIGCRLRTTIKSEIFTICNYIYYSDELFCLQRKKDKFLELVEYVKERSCRMRDVESQLREMDNGGN